MTKKVRIQWMVPAAGGSFNIDIPEDWEQLNIKDKRSQIEYFVDDAVYECFSENSPQFTFEEIEDGRELKTEED